MTGAGVLDLNLGRGRLSTGRGKGVSKIAARGFEHAKVLARHVELVGTEGPNKLKVDACHATVHGLAGRDRITALTNSSGDGQIRCDARRMRFFGGPGPDTLVGAKGRDVLIGGPGWDRADGRRGRDVCQAEKMRHCEVRR